MLPGAVCIHRDRSGRQNKFIDYTTQVMPVVPAIIEIKRHFQRKESGHKFCIMTSDWAFSKRKISLMKKTGHTQAVGIEKVVDKFMIIIYYSGPEVSFCFKRRTVLNKFISEFDGEIVHCTEPDLEKSNTYCFSASLWFLYLFIYPQNVPKIIKQWLEVLSEFCLSVWLSEGKRERRCERGREE